ncbi:MAG: HpcH/HpaI aldolase/citrate lyase family protein [Parafilimonas sp.]
MTENDYIMRSLMFVPAHNEKLLQSASQKDVDVLLLDLEDSVQPTDNKAIARKNIKQRVSENFFGEKLIFPRVNDRESGQLLKDVTELTIPGIHGFVYPKSKSAEDVYFFDKLLETIEYEKGLPIGTYKIIPLIETTAAVLNAEQICKASPRVIAIAYGCEDFIADLGGIHDHDGKSLFTPRAIIAMAAKASNVIPIDTVHINVHDLQELEENLRLAKILGFEGMLVLNPIELPLVHQYFTPTAEEFENAKTLLQLALEARKDGKGVAVINGKFIGPPMIIAAKKLISRYERIKQRQV